MVEAVHLVDLVAERAAHYQPHDEFDAFGTGFAHIIDVLDPGEPLGIFGHAVEKCRIEFAIDETGARSLQLVAHAARAPDLHIEIFVETLDRLADRLSERIAARARRRRVKDDVDHERNDAAGPRL